MTTREGLTIDAAGERQRLQSVLDKATRAGLKIKILEFRAQGRQAFCTVEQRLVTEVYNKRKKKLETTFYRTLSRDRWGRQGSDWKLDSAQVFLHVTGPAPPFPESYCRSSQDF